MGGFPRGVSQWLAAGRKNGREPKAGDMPATAGRGAVAKVPWARFAAAGATVPSEEMTAAARTASPRELRMG
jgi:hypothetical protein